MRNGIALFLALLPFFSVGQGVIGKWKSVDDESGKELAILDIYESNGKIYGRIAEILNPKHRNMLCVNCSGPDKNKPILGMTVLRGLEKDGDEYSGGKILDPKSGKLYSCYITLESSDTMKVRGYIGISLLGRTQYWYRVKE